jgi:predicted acetyltransferase
VDSPAPGFTGLLLVQFEEGGVPTGYVQYRRKMEDLHGAPAGTLLVSELVAATDAAYAGLWQYVFGVDLVANIEARRRPLDEPLWWMLHDPRRLVREVRDALWVRILDVPLTLGTRCYATEGRLVIDVHDEFCPWVAGRYELSGGPEGATCRPASAEPDIRLGIAELGAAYLGGARFQAMRRAGRVDGEQAALRRADAMFAWDPLPWCPEIF